MSHSAQNAKSAYILFNRANVEVTKAYLDVIKAALERSGYHCEYITSLTGISKRSLIVHAVGVDAFSAYLRGYRNFMLWLQGVAAEESYMRNKSRLRMSVLNLIDCFVIQKAKLVFCVSNALREHYQRLIRKDFSSRTYIMPCYNETFDPSVSVKKDYTQKTFSYVGSLDVWQCFEQTVSLFAQIEQAIPSAFLNVLTFHTDRAKEILNTHGIHNYRVACVPKDRVKEELIGTTYGFILRDDIEVNRVATPTKISSYLSAGVIPIYSSCLCDFHEQAAGKQFAIPFDLGQDCQGLIDILKADPPCHTVTEQIRSLFDSYYCTPKHIDAIVSRMEALDL